MSQAASLPVAGVPAPPALRLPAPEPELDLPRPRTRGVMLFGLASIALFVGGFAAWSTLAPLSEAAIAPGQIKVEGQRRVLANQEGGTVREILVHDGDRVQAGQVLLRLDQTQSSATVETVRSQRWALLAQDARLTAELARAREIAFPAALLAAAGSAEGGSGEPAQDAVRAADAVAGQRALFEARRVSLDSQLAVLADRVAQQNAVIASAEQQYVAAQRQLVLIRREEEVKRALMNQGLSRLTEVLALQRNAAALEGQIGDITGQISRARATIAEARSQMKQIEDQRLQEVSTELRDVRGKLAEAEERLRAAQDVSVRREIIAPEDGIIIGLRVFNTGAVVRAGDPVMELVPVRDRLVAEVNLSPNDIDVVYPGLDAQIRLPAFKQRLVPSLNGRVTFVASDVATDERTRQSYYRVQILIDADQLARLPNVHLTPGMPVEAMVQLGERSFFRYITQPIRDSFHRAFREQ
ncbi:HlyD family type I secretion periplasmic adaptor subunit [Roseomonas sp. NAR14]|uniref:Membrane fusion protein (MFP) family protein n=1 Tax=Roseomonas acroporae TaxID=2937791 RepID=A0A9X1Y786_9PROT|nr:HlyD family type I secretion periplasmic adaptor subunit [Roseomonas acroporae]MCK8783362.1 HlyD family type I secretion periplasmic adaptor subunit [Roseomonas acroporae]